MLVQLHWQNREHCDQTEFVAQNDFETFGSMSDWSNEIIARRRDEIPAGFVPAIVVEGSPLFVLGPRQKT